MRKDAKKPIRRVINEIHDCELYCFTELEVIAMDVRYNKNQRDVSNPVFDEKHHLEGQVEIDDHYSMPDESLKNPLMVSGSAKPDKIRIVSLVIECVILCAVALIVILSIVILIKPFVIEQTCTAPLTSAGLSSDDKDFITTTIIANQPSQPNCTTITPEMISSQVVELLHSGSSEIGQNLSQLLQATSDLSQSIAYIKGLADDQAVDIDNNTDRLISLLQSFEDTSLVLSNIVGSLTGLQTTTTSTAGVTNDILLITEDILDLTNRSYLLNYINAVSCQDILRLHPNISSGYYHINSRTVYCNMDQLCGSGGGWTRIGYFDMGDATQNCPSGFRTYSTSGVRACGRLVSGCAPSIKLQTNGISYSQICGRVIGYQYGTPDGFDARGSGAQDINSHYLDGVSITRGSPREHVWSLTAGLYASIASYYNCPCNTSPGGGAVPSFVGSNYFCESGNQNSFYQFRFLYTIDPLWDGQGCGFQEGPCCAAPGLPWFHRDYGNMSSTDSIELRVCGNQGWTDEDTPISYYEIYVK